MSIFSTAATMPSPSRFARLSTLAPVGLDAAACLTLQKSWLACRRCADACPVDCLVVDAAGARLDATACLHCGRCASACPTQALAVDGFAADDLDAAADTFVLACGRAASGDATIRVPCLGGVHVNDLLARLDRHPGACVVLDDSPTCSRCPSGRKDSAPARRLAAQLEPFLRAAALPADCVTVRPPPASLPDGNRPDAHPEPAGAPTGRRDFFAGLGRATSDRLMRRSGMKAARPAAPPAPRRPIAGARNEDTLRLLNRLAARQGGVPAGLPLPAIGVDAACRLHGGCARCCPTGALAVEDTGGFRRLRFFAARCVDCGACATACPEDALRYAAPAWRALAAAAVLVAERRLAACVLCGEPTTAPSDDGRCAQCTKTATLARAGFALSGHSGAARPAETGPP